MASLRPAWVFPPLTLALTHPPTTLQMELLLPDIVDADITTLPVGGGVVVDVAPRQTSPSSRIVDRVRPGWLAEGWLMRGTVVPGIGLAWGGSRPPPVPTGLLTSPASPCLY